MGGDHGSKAEISFGGRLASSAIAACFAEVLHLLPFVLSVIYIIAHESLPFGREFSIGLFFSLLLWIMLCARSRLVCDLGFMFGDLERVESYYLHFISTNTFLFFGFDSQNPSFANFV